MSELPKLVPLFMLLGKEDVPMRLVKLSSHILVLALVLAPFSTAQTDAEAEAEKHFEAARVAEKAGDMARAVTEYQAVLKLMPDVPEVETNLGLVYYAMGKDNEAIPILQKALGTKPELLSANLFLGMSYL